MIEPNRALHFGAKARDLRHSGRLANLGGVPVIKVSSNTQKRMRKC
jgi:hypothetical protein